MRRWVWIPLLAGLLSCDVAPPVTLPVDAAVVASAPPDNYIELPPITVISKRQPRHVLIVGDSEACAVSSYIDLKKLVATINDEDDHAPHDVVDVSCKGGTVVQYWGAGGHLKLALQQHPNPDDVLVFLGTNHYWQKTTPPTNTITDQLKATNCVWVGNTAVHGQHWAINSIIRDAVTPQCTYFDTEAADIPLADGAHPTPTGAVKWIRLVWKTIPPKYEESDERAKSPVQ